MPFPRTLASICLAPVACLVFAGCMPKATTDHDATTLPADVPGRLQILQNDVDELDRAARQLPGESEQVHRQLIAQSFSVLLRILPNLRGNYQSGEFMSGLGVVTATRDQLKSSPADMPTEPPVIQGLFATEKLLASINTLTFDKDEEITKQITSLDQQITMLGNLHGAINRVQAGVAMRGVVDICRVMSSNLIERAGTSGTPTTGPATAPTTGPATAPATAPVIPAAEPGK